MVIHHLSAAFSAIFFLYARPDDTLLVCQPAMGWHHHVVRAGLGGSPRGTWKHLLNERNWANAPEQIVRGRARRSPGSTARIEHVTI
jgi:hypothetical protein